MLFFKGVFMTSLDKDINYSVVFMGEIITGFEQKKVLRNLAKITRMSEKEVLQRFFQIESQRIILKKTPLLEKARKYHGKFSRAGIAVGIQMDFEH